MAPPQSGCPDHTYQSEPRLSISHIILFLPGSVLDCNSSHLLFNMLKDIKSDPCGSVGKEPACHAGDLDLIPGLGRSPGEGKGHPFQYSDLENSMDCIVHGVAESATTE